MAKLERRIPLGEENEARLAQLQRRVRVLEDYIAQVDRRLMQ